MAEKILHKNPRLQAKVCPHVPSGTPDHRQLSVQCLLLPIGGENIWQKLVFWQLHSPKCLKQNQSLLYFIISLLNGCRKYKQNSIKCQNPVKKNFSFLPCAIHFLKKLDRKTDFINTPSLNFLFLKAALYANHKQFLSNCSKQCLLNIFAPQLFCFGSSLFFSLVFKFNLSSFFKKNVQVQLASFPEVHSLQVFLQQL